MRSFLSTLLLAGLAVLLSCQRSSSPAHPTATPDAPTPAYQLISGAESLVAQFALRVDLESLQATLTPVRGAQAQPPQAHTYDLDIENFLRPDSLRIRRVRRTPGGDLELTFRHSHPFPAPDANAAITAQNRADLGYTGRLLILAEGTSQVYFGGEVRLDPTLVADADGYLHPGDLLATTGLTNTAFPYVLLADEAEDNRLGQSNGGLMHGSYEPLAGGWQRSNIGTGTGWTGFDFLHGGQSIDNTFTLRESALGSGPVDLQLAILIKYTDPRGQGGRSRRLPPPTPDVFAFAYRLPYAALDASKVTSTTVASVGATAGASGTLNLLLRDWDATALESAGSLVGEEPDITLVEAGAAGTPVALFDAPALSGSAAALLPAGGFSGEPGDEIPYTGLFLNALGTAPAGIVYGLVRFVDPADSLNDSAYHFGVDPVTIAASPGRALATRTYQVIPVAVGGSGGVPVITAVSPIGTIGCPGSNVTFSATVSGSPTSWSWNFGGGATPNTSTDANPLVTLGAAGTYNGTVTATNGFGTSSPFNFSFTVSAAGGYNSYLFNTTAAGDSGHFPDMELYAGKPIVTSLRYTAGQYFLELSSSSSAIPGGAGDWTTTVVTSFAGQAPTLYQSCYQAMLVHNGRIAITFNNDTTDRMNMAIANVTAPAIPGPSDWTIYELDSVSQVGLGGSQTPDGVLRCSLTVHNGNLAVAYGDQLADDARLALALTDPPLTPADWLLVTVEATGARGPWTDVVSYNDGTPGGSKLWIAHRNETGFYGHLSKCSVATPTGSAAEWTHFDVPNTSFGGRAARLKEVIRAGQPRLLYLHALWTSTGGGGGPGIRVIVSNVQNPTASASDWNGYTIRTFSSAISQMLGSDIEVVGGLPVIAFYDNQSTTTTSSGRLGLARALNSNLDSPTDWQVTFPETDNPSGCWPDLGVLAGGQVAVVHRYGSWSNSPGFGMKFGADLCN